MEVPSRVEQLLVRAVEEQVAEQRAWREALDALTDRLERVEEAVASLRQELSVTVEAGARAAVAGELDGVATELRRQISDLGRLIVNDLGKLPQIIRQASTAAAAVTAPVRSLPGTPDPGLDIAEGELDDDDAAAPAPPARGPGRLPPSGRGRLRRR